MIAYIDESAPVTASGLMYVVTSVVVLKEDVVDIDQQLRQMLVGDQSFLHWKDIARPARPAILEKVTNLPIVAYGAVARSVPPKKQEHARVRALQRLLHTLTEHEGVVEVIIEARSPLLNRRDAATISAARRNGTISTDLRYEHRRKSEEPGLWAADIVTSALAADLTNSARPHHQTLSRVLAQTDWV